METKRGKNWNSKIAKDIKDLYPRDSWKTKKYIEMFYKNCKIVWKSKAKILVLGLVDLC